ncbi:cyclin [Anaeramoeba ignava]|uniref:Cyclin n=1 Tax=Anaeramoeba ignava TaxID=1746090 RepID=A0A9Q0LK40_ANAIG|nr:cyclin [Anaeramoeba ignava]
MITGTFVSAPFLNYQEKRKIKGKKLHSHHKNTKTFQKKHHHQHKHHHKKSSQKKIHSFSDFDPLLTEAFQSTVDTGISFDIELTKKEKQQEIQELQIKDKQTFTAKESKKQNYSDIEFIQKSKCQSQNDIQSIPKTQSKKCKKEESVEQSMCHSLNDIKQVKKRFSIIKKQISKKKDVEIEMQTIEHQSQDEVEFFEKEERECQKRNFQSENDIYTIQKIEHKSQKDTESLPKRKCQSQNDIYAIQENITEEKERANIQPITSLCISSSLHDLSQKHLETMLEKETNRKVITNIEKINDPFFRNNSVDQLSYVCYTLNLSKEAFHLSVEYFQRLFELSCEKITEETELYLNACVFIASKIHEEQPPVISLFKQFFTNTSKYKYRMREAERMIIYALNYDLTPVTIHDFLIYFINKALWIYPIEKLPQITNSKHELELVLEYKQSIEDDPMQILFQDRYLNYGFYSKLKKRIKFPNDLYWCLCELINIALRDSSCLRYKPSILAAAAFGLYFPEPKFIDNIITSFNSSDLITCKNWLKFYFIQQIKAFQDNPDFFTDLDSTFTHLHFHNPIAHFIVQQVYLDKENSVGSY